MYSLELGCIEAFMLFQAKWDFYILFCAAPSYWELGPEECFLGFVAAIASLQVKSESRKFLF